MTNSTKVSELVKALTTSDQIRVKDNFYRVDWIDIEVMTLEEYDEGQTCLITSCEEYFTFKELYDLVNDDLECYELKSTYKSK